MERQREPWLAAIVICLGFFMIMLDTTIVYVALPSILTGLGTSLDSVLWVVNAYLLVYAVLLITTGRLGDIVGQRAMFLAGLVVFTAASGLCGLSADANQLIASRTLQGVGGAMLAPQSLAILTVIFPRERLGAALGLWGGVIGFSTLAGPTVGGWLVTNLDWRWIFFINIPIGAAALVGTLLAVPNVRAGKRHRLDLVGVALSGLALFAITYALIEGQRYDWGQITGIVSIPLLLAIGLLLLLLFAWWERRQAEPLVPLRLFSNRNYSLMNGTMLAITFAIQGIFLPITIYLQSVLGMSALTAGLTIAPMALVSMFAAPVSGRLADRFGGKHFLMPGLLLFGAGSALLLSQTTLDATWSSFVLPLMLAGLGMGFAFPPMTTTAMRDVRSTDAGAASGVLNSTRQIGGVIGSAVVGAILQAQLAVSLHDEAVARAGALPAPARQPFIDGFARAARSGFQVGIGQTGAQLPSGIPAQLAAQIQQLAHDVFVNGYLTAMRPPILVAVAVLVVAALSCLFIDKRPASSTGREAGAGVADD